jgi:hypothetical protein
METIGVDYTEWPAKSGDHSLAVDAMTVYDDGSGVEPEDDSRLVMDSTG